MILENKTAIFYYSGTGNSLDVAKQLQAILPNSILIPIIKHLRKDIKEINFKTIGLVFPIHKMGIPQVVHDFLELVNFKRNSYIFTVITGGNPIFGAGIYQVENLLEKQKQQLHAGFYIKMPATYFPLISLKVKTGLIPNAEKIIEKIEAISTIVNNREYRIERSFRLLDKINQLKKCTTHNASRHFVIDEGCIRCGYCVMVCPLQNIHLEGKEHTFLDNCNTCFACVHYCSKGVVQYKKRTRGRRRYQHPNISIGDLAGQKR